MKLEAFRVQRETSSSGGSFNNRLSFVADTKLGESVGSNEDRDGESWKPVDANIQRIYSREAVVKHLKEIRDSQNEAENDLGPRTDKCLDTVHTGNVEEIHVAIILLVVVPNLLRGSLIRGIVGAMDLKSANLVKVKELLPSKQWAAKQWVSECFDKGVLFEIREIFRSQERQDKLYAQGRWTPGPIVTDDTTSSST